MMHLKPPVLCHMSHVLFLVSHTTLQSFPNRKSQGPAIFVMCLVSHVRCNMSLLICHVSLATCHMSCYTNFFLIFFFYKLLELVGEGSVINEPTFSSFLNFFLLKTQLYTFVLFVLASSSPFWVIKKIKLTRILFKRHWNRLEVPKMVNFRTCGRVPLCTFSKVSCQNQ